MRRSIEEVLAEARSHLVRLMPAEAHAARQAGAAIVDVRPAEQRLRDGWIPGALHFPLDVLEWRLDPDSPSRAADAPGLGDHVVLICRQGFSSSLAARRLQELGFERATDVVGGIEAWASAGLPIERD